MGYIQINEKDGGTLMVRADRICATRERGNNECDLWVQGIGIPIRSNLSHKTISDLVRAHAETDYSALAEEIAKELKRQ